MLPIGMKCRTSRYCLHELKTDNFGFICFSYVLLVCHWAVFANLGLWGVLSARVRLFWFLFNCYFACGVALLALFGLFLNSLQLLLFFATQTWFLPTLVDFCFISVFLFVLLLSLLGFQLLLFCVSSGCIFAFCCLAHCQFLLLPASLKLQSLLLAFGEYAKTQTNASIYIGRNTHIHKIPRRWRLQRRP